MIPASVVASPSAGPAEVDTSNHASTASSTAAVAAVADVVATLRQLGQQDLLDRLDAYAQAADAAAAADLQIVAARPDIDAMAEAVVLGNVLGDALLSALRRLAQVSRSAELFGGDAV